MTKTVSNIEVLSNEEILKRRIKAYLSIDEEINPNPIITHYYVSFSGRCVPCYIQKSIAEEKACIVGDGKGGFTYTLESKLFKL